MRTLRRILGVIAALVSVTPAALRGAPLAPDPVRRVNVPYFSGDVRYSEMAVFWFGYLDSTNNSVDVRVGYNSTHLYLNLSIYDRYLWYDPSPEDSPLDAWDAGSIYLDTTGDGGQDPDGDDYRFVGQLNWWESGDEWQAVYQGNGSGWSQTALPFTVTSGWRGDAPNNGNDDRAWVLRVYIPFQSLGLSGPPPQGTMWRLGIAVHDRDDAGGAHINDKVWPDAFSSQAPSTWGGLIFGLPTYEPPPATEPESAVIREGLAGAVVPDAAVGGSVGNMCPGDPGVIWYSWANRNLGDVYRFSIQNQGDVSDFPCFCRYYVQFPLDVVPEGKVIQSATLTLYRWGGADPAQARPSLIQAFAIADPWSESTITWNNGPLAVENIARTWVDPVEPGGVTIPGEPYTWDVSQAAADAYAAGAPVSLALYEADWAYHSGKYFIGSEEEDYYAYARPALEVVWGEPVSALDFAASPTSVPIGEVVVYTFSILGTGQPMTLTNELPAGISAPYELDPELTYASGEVTWNGSLPAGERVELSYAVTVEAASPTGLTNGAILVQANGQESTATAVVIANPLQVYLPQVTR